MGLLDTTSEEPRSKAVRYIVTAVALVILTSFGVWFFFLRFLSEKRTVEHFMAAVAAGNYDVAYKIWMPPGKAHGNYTFGDFLADWNEQGYYGPIHSYHIESASLPRNGGSGVVVVVEISPYAPFPDDQDPKSGRDREVSLWVERSDNSLGFPPP